MQRTKAFISYARHDADWLRKLLNHIAVLERWQLIHAWSDTSIEVGDTWEDKIETALAGSKVAVLLVSPAFMASDYIWRKEMPAILQHVDNGMKVLPLIIRPCAWRLDPSLAAMQARPEGGRALSLGNPAQIDLDLAAFVYELAALLGRFPPDVAALEREIADRYRQSLPTEAPRAVLPSTETARATRYWTGRYDNRYNFAIELTTSPGGNVTGQIDYSGTGTVTRLEGSVTEMSSSDAGEGTTHLEFKELDYVRKGSKVVPFDGWYKAVLTPTTLTGSWHQGDRRVAGFSLTSADPPN